MKSSLLGKFYVSIILILTRPISNYKTDKNTRDYIKRQLKYKL